MKKKISGREHLRMVKTDECALCAIDLPKASISAHPINATPNYSPRLIE